MCLLIFILFFNYYFLLLIGAKLKRNAVGRKKGGSGLFRNRFQPVKRAVVELCECIHKTRNVESFLVEGERESKSEKIRESFLDLYIYTAKSE